MHKLHNMYNLAIPLGRSCDRNICNNLNRSNLQKLGSLFFFNILFYSKARVVRERKRQRKIFFYTQFSPRMALTAGFGASMKPGTWSSSRVCMGKWAKYYGQLPPPFQAGKWIACAMPGTQCAMLASQAAA